MDLADLKRGSCFNLRLHSGKLVAGCCTNIRNGMYYIDWSDSCNIRQFTATAMGGLIKHNTEP